MALLNWQCGPSADGCCAIESCREEAELDCYRAPALPCRMQANYGMLLMGPYWLHGHDCSKTLVVVEFTWLSCVWPAGEGCAPSPPPFNLQKTLVALRSCRRLVYAATAPPWCLSHQQSPKTATELPSCQKTQPFHLANHADPDTSVAGCTLCVNTLPTRAASYAFGATRAPQNTGHRFWRAGIVSHGVVVGGPKEKPVVEPTPTIPCSRDQPLRVVAAAVAASSCCCCPVAVALDMLLQAHSQPGQHPMPSGATRAPSEHRIPLLAGRHCQSRRGGGRPNREASNGTHTHHPL